MPHGGREIFDRARGVWERVRGRDHGAHGGYGGPGRYGADRGMRHVDRGWADMGDRGFEPGSAAADNDYSFMEWDRGAADLGNMRRGWSSGGRGWTGRGYDAGYEDGPSRMGPRDMGGGYVNRHGPDSGYRGGRSPRDPGPRGGRGYAGDFGQGYGGDYGRGRFGTGYDRGFGWRRNGPPFRGG